jgi:PucR C-terminal helix-turn-helix domain/GGDEF-like domain
MTALASRAWVELAERLRARSDEIERAILNRVYAISDPAAIVDPSYAEGLRAAISSALDYGLAGLADGDRRAEVPVALLAQARLAARNGVGLDTVLRRYLSGYALLVDFLIEEAQGAGSFSSEELKRLHRSQSTKLDRLIAAISEEYAREASLRIDTSERRRADVVRRFLEGELVDTSELAYDFDGNHLGLVAVGVGASQALQRVADSLDRRLLLARPDETTAWAWLGGRRAFDPAAMVGHFDENLPGDVSVAMGEPGKGRTGWSLTHRQAAAALPIALRSAERLVRYGDVALVASILRDDLLATSLRQLYLAPLEQERDGGETLRKTLRAYFLADGNISSAAAALGVNRHTVASRLRTVEEKFDFPVDSRAADLEAALQLDRLDHPADSGRNLLSR